MLETRPEMAEALLDPINLQRAMRAAMDPAYKAELMQSSDQAMQRLMSHEGGEAALQRFWRDSMGPRYADEADAARGTDETIGAAPSTHEEALREAADARRHAEEDRTGPVRATALPNPWARPSAPPAGMGMGMGMGGFTAAGMPGMPGAAGGFGGATPAIGGATPVIGGATPRVGGATPAYGGATPAYGGATPAYGGATPMAGGATPKYGGATPRTGAAAEESEAWRPTAFSGATGGLGAEGEAGDAADLRAAAATMGTVPSSLSAGASAPSERWRRWCVERAVVQLVADPTQVAYVVAPPPPGLTGEAARARLRWIEGASSGQDEDVAMHRLEPKPVSESDTVRCLDDNKKGQIFGIENGEAVVQLEDNDFSNKQMRDLVVLYEGGS